MRKDKEEYIVNLVKHSVGKGLWQRLEMMRDTTPLTLDDVVSRCCSRVSRAVDRMSYPKLGALCDYALQDSGECAWSMDFYQVTYASSVLPLGLPSRVRNPREVLKQLVYAIILCLAYDILKQDEYRRHDEAQKRSFACH